MRRILYNVFFITVVFLNVHSQYVSSPCPNIFSYQSDETGVYGLIHLEHTGGGPISTLQLRANFTVTAQLLSSYIGRIETIGKGALLQNFNRGGPLNYRVNFPVTSPLPRLTAIVANGEILCYGPGDIPVPNQYITTISLDHKLFTKAGGGPGNNQYAPAPSSDLIDSIVGALGDNTLTTINLDNKGSWMPVYYPFNNQGNEESTVFVYEQPVSRPNRLPSQPPSRPSNRPRPTNKPEIYYLEQVTETIRPPKPEVHRHPSRPRPSKPEIYYPEPVTEITRRPVPQTLATQSPTQAIPSIPARQPEISTQIECGVIADGNDRITPLIYQGHSYPRGDLPWLVALYKRQEGSLSFICAGTLVSVRHIITAAHCMHQRSKISSIKDMVVKVGVYNLEDWGDDISVTRTLQAAAIHESYNATTLENDILVLTMERTVEFNANIRPACLWSGNTDLSRIVGASGVVAGWGASEVGAVGQGEPRMVRIPVVSTAQCRASKPEFHKLTSAKTLCAGDRKGAGPCLGDSGGGLYILDNGRWRLRGVVSLSLRPQSGDNTCNLDEYIVFTDTAQYLGWIRKILSKNYYDT